MDTSRFIKTFAGVCLLLMQLSFNSYAQQLETPSGQTILAVSGVLAGDLANFVKADGEPVKVRDNGPLWIIHPWKNIPDLRRPHHDSNLIWQKRSSVVLP